MSLNAMTSLARVTRRRSAQAPTSGLPNRVPDHPDRVIGWFMILLLICVVIARRPGGEDRDLGLHLLAQSLMAFGQSFEGPVERADRVCGLKDRQREAVPLFLKLPQCRLTARKDRGRGPFRIAQRIRNAVRGQRIPEEASIANQHPARTVSLSKPAGCAPECFKAFDTIGERVCPKSGCQRIQRPLPSGDKVGTKFGIETARWDGDHDTREP